MNTKIDRPLPLAEQKKVYEAIKVVHEAEQAWWFAVNDGTSGGSPKERYIVLALLEAGWKPPYETDPSLAAPVLKHGDHGSVIGDWDERRRCLLSMCRNCGRPIVFNPADQRATWWWHFAGGGRACQLAD